MRVCSQNLYILLPTKSIYLPQRSIKTNVANKYNNNTNNNGDDLPDRRHRCRLSISLFLYFSLSLFRSFFQFGQQSWNVSYGIQYESDKWRKKRLNATIICIPLNKFIHTRLLPHLMAQLISVLIRFCCR